jgi:hypothetical protein
MPAGGGKNTGQSGLASTALSIAPLNRAIAGLCDTRHTSHWNLSKPAHPAHDVQGDVNFF